MYVCVRAAAPTVASTASTTATKAAPGMYAECVGSATVAQHDSGESLFSLATYMSFIVPGFAHTVRNTNAETSIRNLTSFNENAPSHLWRHRRRGHVPLSLHLPRFDLHGVYYFGSH